MREDPKLDIAAIFACLETHYGIAVASVRFLPIGYDLDATVHHVVAQDGTAYFLKVRSGPVHAPGLLVPRALIERGVPNILAPLPLGSGELWCHLAGEAGATVVLYPFVRGENAMVAGMSDAQWRTFGETLAAVHASGLERDLGGLLPAETFALPSAALVRRIAALVAAGEVGAVGEADPAAARLATAWRAHAARIRDTLERAEALGRALQRKTFPHVLCHADIHGANVLVGEDGRIHLIDWDGPVVAPRERDLLFVVGSRIAGVVEPREEDLFFAGYGPVEIDRDALVYYRYERIVEDIGEFAKAVFLDPSLGEEARAAEAEMGMRQIVPGGPIDRAEVVSRVRFPDTPG